MGPRHKDELVLKAAQQYEQAVPWNENQPDL